MARAHILKSFYPTQVLRPRGQVEAFVPVDVSSVVAHIIRILIIGDGMNDIDINTVDRVDDLDEPIESNPGIVVDRNTKILVNGLSTQRDAAKSICLVQLVHPTARHIDPEVTRDGKHSDVLCRRIDGDDNISLSQVGMCPIGIGELLVGITAQQENIDATTGQNVATSSAHLIRVLVARQTFHLLADDTAEWRGQRIIIVASHAASNKQEQNHHEQGYLLLLAWCRSRSQTPCPWRWCRHRWARAILVPSRLCSCRPCPWQRHTWYRLWIRPNDSRALHWELWGERWHRPHRGRYKHHRRRSHAQLRHRFMESCRRVTKTVIGVGLRLADCLLLQRLLFC